MHQDLNRPLGETIKSVECGRALTRRYGSFSDPAQVGVEPLLPMVVRADHAEYAPMEPFDFALARTVPERIVGYLEPSRIGECEYTEVTVSAFQQLREWSPFHSAEATEGVRHRAFCKTWNSRRFRRKGGPKRT
jgi:hypothetical protein